MFAIKQELTPCIHLRQPSESHWWWLIWSLKDCSWSPVHLTSGSAWIMDLPPCEKAPCLPELEVPPPNPLSSGISPAETARERLNIREAGNKVLGIKLRLPKPDKVSSAGSHIYGGKKMGWKVNNWVWIFGLSSVKRRWNNMTEAECSSKVKKKSKAVLKVNLVLLPLCQDTDLYKSYKKV